MTVNELVQKMMEHADELAVESYEMLPTDKTEPVRKHRKKRIQKKWLKRYGVKPVLTKRKCKRIDVTPQMMIDFCIKHELPMPTDMVAMFGNY